MRVKNQEISDAILKFVNKYFHENRKAPTISEIADGVGVARSTTHRYMQDLSDNGLLDYSRGILSAPESAKMKTAYIAAPLVGSIQCGCPEEEQEYVEEYVSLPVSMFGKGDFYILRAKGDSMVDAGIEEDDLLVIERNCPASEGDIVVALDPDNQNTLKRYAGYDEDLPPYLFVMLGLYAGLRREEILGLQWDCVHIDEDIPYISVRRAWRSVKNRPEVTTLLKTPAAKRDIPIPQLLADCLKAEKEKSSSDYVISDSNGEPLSDSQFCRLWHYITVRRVKERKIYRYINGEKIHHTISPKLGERCRTDKSIYYTLDFNVTPHLLRHTYITNLIHEGVDPKTVQYLAGHENSKVTMDIYAKVKYNKPWELAAVVNEAFQPSTEYRENPAS